MAGRALPRREGEVELRGPCRIEHLDAQLGSAGEGPGKKHLRGVAPALPARDETNPGEVIDDATFEIDRLPEPGERAVPTLFSERDFGEGRIRELGRVVGRAVDPDLDL